MKFKATRKRGFVMNFLPGYPTLEPGGEVTAQEREINQLLRIIITLSI